MAVEIRIHDGVVHVSASDMIDTAAIIDTLESIARHPDFRPGLSQLIDLADVSEFLSTPDGIREVVAWEHAHREMLGQRRCAMVAPDDYMFGMVRMYEMLTEDKAVEVQVFRKREEAVSWLSDSAGARRG